MTTTHRNRLVTTISNTPGSASALTISAASPGYRTFTAGDDGLSFDVSIVDGTAWEIRTGCVYTHAGTSLSRGTLTDSSTGSAITLTSSAVVTDSATALFANNLEAAMQGLTPGGRLTLTSGLPFTTADVAAATTVYFTPFVHNLICLWDGSRWTPTTFTETSLALGTLTSGLPYDVYGYLSSGVLALEMLSWTNSTTRATDATLQDGRYCKNGDKTRLLLGTFYTTATTTTEDSAVNRLLSNVYNRLVKSLAWGASGVHTYSSTTYRDWNGVVQQASCVTAIAQILDWGSLRHQADGTTAVPRLAVDMDVTTPGTGLLASQTQPVTMTLVTMGPINPTAITAGRHYFRMVEKAESAAAASFSTGNIYLSLLC